MLRDIFYYSNVHNIKKLHLYFRCYVKERGCMDYEGAEIKRPMPAKREKTDGEMHSWRGEEREREGKPPVRRRDE